MPTHCAVFWGTWSSSLSDDGSIHSQNVSHLQLQTGVYKYVGHIKVHLAKYTVATGYVREQVFFRWR